MRYFLCQVFPPLAVLACGKPFVAFLNLILWVWPWSSSRLHAMQVVSMYEEGRVIRGAIGGESRPRQVRGRRKEKRLRQPEPGPISDPTIGTHGTRFRRRRR